MGRTTLASCDNVQHPRPDTDRPILSSPIGPISVLYRMVICNFCLVTDRPRGPSQKLVRVGNIKTRLCVNSATETQKFGHR